MAVIYILADIIDNLGSQHNGLISVSSYHFWRYSRGEMGTLGQHYPKAFAQRTLVSECLFMYKSCTKYNSIELSHCAKNSILPKKDRPNRSTSHLHQSIIDKPLTSKQDTDNRKSGLLSPTSKSNVASGHSCHPSNIGLVILACRTVATKAVVDLGQFSGNITPTRNRERWAMESDCTRLA